MTILTNVIFLRIIAITLMIVVTAVYFLQKEPTVKSFIAGSTKVLAERKKVKQNPQ